MFCVKINVLLPVLRKLCKKNAKKRKTYCASFGKVREKIFTRKLRTFRGNPTCETNKKLEFVDLDKSP